MNPFAGLCKDADKRARSVARWEERQLIRERLGRKDTDKYRLGFGWRVHAVRNKECNILQISAFHRAEFAFSLIDVVPSQNGFALRLSDTGTRKHGRYNSETEALAHGRQWLIKHPKYAIGLQTRYLKETHEPI